MGTKKNENELFLILQKEFFLEILKGQKKGNCRISRLCKDFIRV